MGCSNLKPTACGNGRKPYLTTVGCGNTIHFDGLDNETINQGIGIDLLDGVTAYDSDGDEIPFTVSPEDIDKCDVGRHTVTYTATGKGAATIPYLCGKDELETPSCGNVTRSQDRTIVITQADDPVISGADYIEIEPNTDFNPLDGVSAVDDNGNVLTPTYSGTYEASASGSIVSFNGNGDNLISLVAQIKPMQSGSGNPSIDNVRPITGWPSVNILVSPTESAGDATTINVNLSDVTGTPVYGGTVDPITGLLTVTKKLSTVTHFDSSWGNRGNGYVVEVRSLGNKRLSRDSICNMFVAKPDLNVNSLGLGEYMGGFSNTDNWLFVLPSTITSLTEANEWLENLSEPIVLTENLETPVTYQLTPQTIASLQGVTNIWADSGDIDVEYIASIPQGTFQYAENGLYEITYTAEDECGNSTTVVRQIQVGAITYRTVIYTDGTMIINESSNDIDANIEAHGSPTHIYEPLNEDGTNYVWTSEPNALWHESSAVYRIKQVEIGSEIYPTSTAFWFYDLRYCTHIDLNGIHTDNVTSMRYMFGYVGYFEEMADVIDVSMFNTENVTDMSSMFNHCMVTSIDVSGFDTSKVTNMNRMFGYCANLERICSSGRFVIYNVTDGSNTFYDDTNLIGGNGTAYSYNYIDVSYARLDDPPNEPGYFTDCSA